MDRVVVIASVCGLGVFAAWFLRAQAAIHKASAAAENETEKAASATARAVQKSIKARR